MNEIGTRVNNHTHPLIQNLIESPASEPEFWSEVERLGTPLIEPDPDSSYHSLVTFVAVLPAKAAHVVVQPGGFADPPTHQLNRIRGTRTLWACFRYRNDVRLHYSFAVDMPLVSWNQANEAQLKQIDQTFLTASKDEYNSKTIPLQKRTVSLLELRNAPDESLVAKREGIKRGHIDEVILESRILGQTRKLWLYKSHEGENIEFKILLVVFDGGWYLSLIPTHRILDNLNHDGLIEPTIAVFIDTPPETRDIDLSYNDSFANFVVEELVPWIRQNNRVSSREQDVYLAGSSLGGLASMWLGHTFPQVFGNVICQAGVISVLDRRAQSEIEDNRLTDLFAQSEPAPLCIWLEVGLLDDHERIVEPSRDMARLLAERGYNFEFHEFAGGHDFALWRGTLSLALKKFLAKPGLA